MNFTQLKNVFASVLYPLGYRNRKGFFFRKCDNVFTLIELDRIPWGKSYNLDFGVYIDETGTLTEPPRFHVTPLAHVQSAIQSVVEQPLRGKYLAALNLANPMKDEEREAILKEALTQHVLPLLEKIDTLEKIVNYRQFGDRRKVMFTNGVYDVLLRLTGIDFRPKPLTAEQQREAEKLYRQAIEEMREVLGPMGVEIVELPPDRDKRREKDEDTSNEDKGS